MYLTITFLLVAGCVTGAIALSRASRDRLNRAKDHMNRLSSSERALANPEVVDIVNKMIREPWIEDPQSHIDKRRNKKRILLRVRLKGLVPDNETRKMIYTFIHRQTNIRL